MQARISELPAKEEASWGAVYAVVQAEHRHESGWHFHWRAIPDRDHESALIIEAPGEDVDALRAEIEEAIDLVNDIVKRDPLGQMVEIDAGHVEVLVD